MELFQVELSGFKKFKEKAALKTQGKLLAILGPNEAGKSSLLKALQRLNNDAKFELSDRSRGGSSQPTIKATYLLSQQDREAVGMTVGTWYDLTKYSDGQRKWEIRPKPPARDYSHRKMLVSKLSRLTSKDQAYIDEDDDGLFADTKKLLEEIFGAEDELSDAQKKDLAALAARWDENSSPEDSPKIEDISNGLTLALRVENEESKYIKAGSKLWDLMPEILFFGDDDRDLRSSYLWSDLAAIVPVSVHNLAKVAELDLPKLISIATTNPNDPEFDTLMERANSALERNFQAAWNQSKVSVVLAHREQSLLIQVYNNDRARTDFAQRSDGLRQFVALRCFTAARDSKNFILLIDEAEQHLHYDAQADLVQMLAGQSVASKVIYTTHSVGCLPEDLGNGVRLVLPMAQNSDWSKIENKFWASRTKHEAAFSPILMGMGARTMAFFPTRAAVLVEGPADTILLPTIMRESLGRTSLGVQFVHGLSEDGHISLPLLNSTGIRVCYLLDNDGGGRALGKQLVALGADKNRVFYFPKTQKDVELEDIIDSKLLAEAASTIARQHLAIEALVSETDLSKFGKWDTIVQKCAEANVKPLDKVPVAYQILELLGADPGRSALDKRHFVAFKAVAEKLVEKAQEVPT